ncbi:hypothetical protein F4778DRAFT_779715 [Xylariomycetidae sp. FL2044]|nr:hypothetical protein F4778DRAFT_779715 [Xylariomycetidae sp. FL2044]
MAEVLGLVSSIIAVIELSAKAVGRCKSLIETAKDAPRDLRAILVEVSSLHSALENLQFLQSVDGDLSDNVSQDESLNTAVHGCQNTLGELVDELDSLTISNHEPTATGKRQRIKTAIKWTWKEDSARKLLADLLQHKATITVCLLSEAVHEIREVKSMVNGIHQKLTDEERRKFCSWMEQTNPTQIHASSRDNYEPGTVEWMFRMPQWSSWIAANSPSRSLWIHGIPGAGKTILASRLYKECQSLCSQKNRLGEECLYYYCSYRNNQDETIPALRWIISQVCRKPVYNIPEEVYHMYQQNTTADLETLIRALAILMAQMKTLYLFIDGVDESRPRTQLLSLLKTIITDARFQNLHLLVTSRDYIEIREVLAPLCSTIPMSNEEVDKDIKLFVTSELDKKFIRWREPHKDEVAEILTNKAQGM